MSSLREQELANARRNLADARLRSGSDVGDDDDDSDEIQARNAVIIDGDFEWNSESNVGLFGARDHQVVRAIVRAEVEE